MILVVSRFDFDGRILVLIVTLSVNCLLFTFAISAVPVMMYDGRKKYPSASIILYFLFILFVSDQRI